VAQQLRAQLVQRMVSVAIYASLAMLATHSLMVSVRSTCVHAAVTALGPKGQLVMSMVLTFAVRAMMAIPSQMAHALQTSVHAAVAHPRLEQLALQMAPISALIAMKISLLVQVSVWKSVAHAGMALRLREQLVP